LRICREEDVRFLSIMYTRSHTFITIAFYFFLFAGIFVATTVFGATQSQTFITSNYTGSQGGTLTNNLPFIIECPDGHKISRIRIPVDTSTGSVNVSLLQATTTLKTDTVTVSDNFLPTTVVDHTFTNPVPCETNTFFNLIRTSGAGNLLIPTVDTTNTGQFASISSVYAYATTTTDYLTVIIDTQYETSSGGTVFVPVESQLNALECISLTPTTTCEFDYSTSTSENATSTFVYTAFDDSVNVFLLVALFLMVAGSVLVVFNPLVTRRKQ